VADEVAEVDEDMIADGNKNTAVTTIIRNRRRTRTRSGLVWALLVFLDARGTR